MRVQKNDEMDRGQLNSQRPVAAIALPIKVLYCNADTSTSCTSKFKAANLPVPGLHRMC